MHVDAGPGRRKETWRRRRRNVYRKCFEEDAAEENGNFTPVESLHFHIGAGTRGNGIRLAISNPCFELWGILHYQDQNAPLERQECQRQLGNLCPDYNAGAGKVFDNPEAIGRLYSAAVERAALSVKRRQEEGDPGGNPSTTVHLLTELIRCFKRRAKRGK